MKSVIPNTLTALNLFCGSIAVLAFLNHFYLLGIILVFTAALADFLDGFVARLLKVQSELGKQLDSLADMISFGFIPGTILYIALLKTQTETSFSELIESKNYVPFIGFLITVFSGLRLAKFNIDTRQSTSFIGLPTPANTIFFMTLPILWLADDGQGMANQIISNQYILIGLTLLFSYLLIAELPLLALKFKNFSWKENKFKYILITCAIVFSITLKTMAIPCVIICYILLSVINNFSSK